MAVDLMCHPSTPDDAARRIVVRVVRVAGAGLEVAFDLEGDLDRVRIPAARPPRMTTGLWRSTCFEVFAAVEGGAAYHEWNLAPSGEWAVFGFRGYRDGELLEDPSLAPEITARSTKGHLELRASIPTGRVPGFRGSCPLRLGLSAVVESLDGKLSYWALRHPRPEPDFHHQGSFAFRLEKTGH